MNISFYSAFLSIKKSLLAVYFLIFSFGKEVKLILFDFLLFENAVKKLKRLNICIVKDFKLQFKWKYK